MTLKGRDVISIHDLTREELVELLALAKKMHDAEKQKKAQLEICSSTYKTCITLL